MKTIHKLLICFFVAWSGVVFSQLEEDPPSTIVADTIAQEIDYLNMKSPIKASLYSAVAPGLGQIYNEKVWKAPIVWGLLGTGVGFTIYFNNDYKKFKGYYIARLEGRLDDIPTGYDRLSAEQLGRIQDDKRRYRDYAIGLTALVYVLNIIDASVDAHLFGINKDPDLAINPMINYDSYLMQTQYGIALNFKF
ncbi:DUF5683 domain-containing protein [Vaginella massiliensis]|uniref:DUF5683 domain-containing protein n=1 Tax=Vaginella massiliensis TaxID=1816680 RepID=UPI00083845E8|nr:DUF5683 domain-containing protein [Vaginella massiliensis]